MNFQNHLSPSLSIPLPSTVHAQAEQDSQAYPNPGKAEQVYLNALAAYAGRYYLQLLGYELDTSASACQDALMRSMMDVADVAIARHGHIECRPVPVGESVMVVPPEAWGDRIAYLAVQLEDDLSTATLLGFVKQVTTPEVPLDTLQPLDTLTEYLAAYEQVDLSQWWRGVFQTAWIAVEEVLQPSQFELSPALRGRHGPQRTAQVERGCPIKLGKEGPQISLVLSLKTSAEHAYGVAVEFWPAVGQYLPAALRLAILDDEEEMVLEAQTRDDNQKIAMEFEGETGDRFSILMRWQEFSTTYSFLL